MYNIRSVGRSFMSALRANTAIEDTATRCKLSSSSACDKQPGEGKNDESLLRLVADNATYATRPPLLLRNINIELRNFFPPPILRDMPTTPPALKLVRNDSAAPFDHARITLTLEGGICSSLAAS